APPPPHLPLVRPDGRDRGEGRRAGGSAHGIPARVPRRRARRRHLRPLRQLRQPAGCRTRGLTVTLTASPTPPHAHRQPPRRLPTGPALATGACIVVVLVLTDLFAPALFPEALPARAQDGLTLALSVLIE